MAGKIIALMLLVVVAGALLWSAGEAHYQSCIQERLAAVARAAPTQDGSIFEPTGVPLQGCGRSPL